MAPVVAAEPLISDSVKRVPCTLRGSPLSYRIRTNFRLSNDSHIELGSFPSRTSVRLSVSPSVTRVLCD